MKNLFNDGWSFSKLTLEHVEPTEGKKAILFEPEDFLGKEKTFEPVSIPHDWLIHNTDALYEDSVGFYKKTFSLSTKEKHFALRFDGVYMNWCVFVNGSLACKWKYGYSTVEFDITPFVKDGENTVELIAVYQSPNTRWYSGAGIFRNVYLVEHSDTHIANGGIYFTASPKGSDWNVEISTEIEGPADGVTVVHSLLDGCGNELSLLDKTQTCKKTASPAPCMGSSCKKDREITLNTFTALAANPELWSCENPCCYTLRTELVKNGTLLDSLEQNVGFRTICFDANKGFMLNGKQVKLHGACQHHDLGLLGAAFDITALKRQFAKLKDMGCNAIRTTHNPAAPELLDLADKTGFLIVDECFDMWERTKTLYDYANYFREWHDRDLSAFVRRDRNHPSVIMWSVGNEIYDTYFPEGLPITKDLVSIVRRHDPKKNAAVTIGSNFMQWEGAQNCAKELDAVGYNYTERLYDEHHKNYPSWCIYGSETSSTVQSRGIYHFPHSNNLLTHEDHQCSSLANCTTSWGSKSTAYNIVQDRDRNFCAGQFIWTGWDYIGEPTPYHTKNSYFGQIDTAGFEKDSFYQYKQLWNEKADPFVHLLPYWDFNEGQLIDVRTYSNGAFVELFVNGVSLGKKENDINKGDSLCCMWEGVPYKAGKIEALAYDKDGKILAREEKHSFGDSEKIILTREEFSEDGLHFIDVSTVDAEGYDVADSRSRIFVTVKGDAVLCGLDNGDSTDPDQYQSKDGVSLSKRLFANRMLIMVRETKPSASFEVTAESAGLIGAKLCFDGSSAKVSELEKAPLSKGEIPVRKIELVCSGIRSLDQNNKEVTVKALVHPANASDKTLCWKPMMLEGVESDCASVSVQKNADEETATVKARSDGSFRLLCSAKNGCLYPQVLSELEFTVSGLGTANRNPYSLIEACKCDRSLSPVTLSFDGGVQTPSERTWYLFDHVDFGVQGSDSITIPVFTWDPEAELELWEGCPDEGGRKIMDLHYRAPSAFNAYTSNTFVLPRCLFGLHVISIACSKSLSIQGFKAEQGDKAFAKLSALDANSVVGDSFTRTEDAVSGIGNNVSLVFNDMNFAKAASKITVCGRAHVDNTIHVRFSGESGDANRIVEFKKNDSYEERTFNLEGCSGKNTVTFVFLPGSNFDFKWFRFE